MNSQHNSTGLSRPTANHSQTIRKERERWGKGRKGRTKQESKKKNTPDSYEANLTIIPTSDEGHNKENTDQYP